MELTTTGNAVLRVSLERAVQYFREKRFNRLIKGLENGEINIDNLDLQSDQFIACFLKTNEAIEKSATKKKVDFLVKLFVKGIKECIITDKPDYYSELISIFSDLSYREIEVLYLIGGVLPYDEKGLDNCTVGEKNEEAVQKLANHYNVSEESAYALISRLQRTGLVVGSNVLARWPYVKLSQAYKDIWSFLQLQVIYRN